MDGWMDGWMDGCICMYDCKYNLTIYHVSWFSARLQILTLWLSSKAVTGDAAPGVR